MPTIYQSDNPSNSYTFPPIEIDEFLPIVEIIPEKIKDSSKNIFEINGDELSDTKEEATLSEYLDSNKRTIIVQQLLTNKKKLKLSFKVRKGISYTSVFEQDDDGYIEPKLSIEDTDIKITSSTQLKKKYGDQFEIEITHTAKESKEYYIDFYANDNEDDFNVGEYKNVYCGRMKIVYKVANQWQFSKEKIEKIKKYAIANNAKYNSRGDANRYHHCTDTHKYIIYELLDHPSDLDLGKDQNHLPSANRVTPNDFKKAGEATTDGVRNTLIAKTYAESPKTFTVIDINNNEVLLSNGQPGNTDTELKSFKESPVEYIKTKCPDNGYYVFIGAYNADYHSFTIVVNKENDNFSFIFIDQILGVANYTANSLEKTKLLEDIYNFNFNFPMKLELYQLRNKKNNIVNKP
ncbi:hypothetical protein ACFSTE_19640 [Aquimarina hainanensis]|uniref:Uncharacterized protein n=1 Tax=Aquimarina hainanensis TaxID=1578017 RepID=A0ABW5NBT4_9FLAO